MGGGNALVGCGLQGRAGEQEEGGWEKLWLVCGMSRKPLNKKIVSLIGLLRMGGCPYLEQHYDLF